MSKKKKFPPQNVNKIEISDKIEDIKGASEEITEESSAADEKKPEKRRIFVFSRKKFKKNVWAAAFTAAVIAAVVLLNVVVGTLSDRFALEADFTQEGLYTLNDETVNYLENYLDCEIEITVASSKKEFEQGSPYFRQAAEILGKIGARSEKVGVRYLDLTQNPDFAAQFPSEELSNGCLVVQNKENGRYKIITPMEYFGLTNDDAMYFYYYYGYIAQSFVEQETVSAMLYVEATPAVVGFTEGFGETGFDALKNLITKNGYESKAVNLIAGDVPEDVDILVIYAPKADLTDAELEKLDKFLENDGEYGKNILYFASSEQPKTPKLDEFLADWGIAVGYSVIGQSDPAYTMVSSQYYHLQQIPENQISNAYGTALGSDLRPVYEVAGAKTVLTSLMYTYDGAYLRPLDVPEFDVSKAEKGVFRDVILAEKTVSGKTSRVLVSGSVSLAGSYFLNNTNIANSQFYVDIFDNFCGRMSGITITPKSFSAVVFEMSAQTADVLAVVLCGVLPSLIIAAGVVVYVRRRHR